MKTGNIFVGRVLQISDVHGHHVDPIAWKLFLNHLKNNPPDKLIINGDFLDFEDASSFISGPNTPTTADEIDKGNELLTEIREVFYGSIEFVPGNHEKRLERLLRTDAKKLAGLKVLELPNLLNFHTHNVTPHQEDGFLLRPDFYVYHGSIVRKHAGMSAQGEMEKNGISGISGHTHRLGTYRKQTMFGRWTWTESGCLCIRDPEYVLGTANWQQGFVEVEFHSKEHGDWTVREYEIVNGRVA